MTRPRPISSTMLVVAAALAVGCAGGGAEGEGEGEGEGDAAEGEGDAGEGEGEAVAFQFEKADGSVIAGNVLDLGAVDAGAGAVVVDLAIRNLGATDFAILTDPPLLVAGRDALFFSVVTQPADVVPAGQAVPFTMQYLPTSSGQHEGKLLFAYGLATEDRAILTVDAVASGAAPGVSFAVYDGAFSALPDFSTLTPTATGVLPNFDISSRADTDQFAFTFDGFVLINTQGTYTFFVTSDDGSRLAVDGAVVVDNDLDHGAVEVAGNVDLDPGLHAIHVEFYEDLGGELLTVEWQGPDFARELVPDDRLFVQGP